MQQIINSILPIFLLIILGFIAQKITNAQHPVLTNLSKLGLLPKNGWTHVLNQYALYIGLPALILFSLISTPIAETVSGDVINFTLISSAVFLAAIFFITKLFKINTKFANSILLCGYLGNVAYIGFPYLSSLISGSEPAISIIVGIHIAITFTFILYLLEKHLAGDVSFGVILKRLFTQPLLLAVLLGVILSLSKFVLHPVLLETISMLAKSASPVVLIGLGAFFATSLSKPKHPFQIAVLSSIKLLAFPLISFLIAYGWFNVQSVAIPLLESAMPVAITNFALAQRYKLDKQTIGYAIIISTIISFVTISLLTGFII